MTEAVNVQRTFAAPIQRVYDAFTTAEDFAVWFGTDAVEIPVADMTWNATPGGEWSATMHLPDGTTKPWVGSFIELERPTRVVFDLTDEPENPARLPVTVELAETADGTAVSLTQPTPGWPAEAQAGLTAGYNAFFDSLADLLAR